MTTLFKSGVLVLTYLPKSKHLHKIITEAAKCVNNTLYIDLLTTSKTQPASLPVKDKSGGNVLSMSEYYSFVTDVYTNASNLCSEIDVRVLLPPLGLNSYPRATQHPIELCIGNTSSIQNLMEFENAVSSRYIFHDGRFHLKYIHAVDDLKAKMESQIEESRAKESGEAVTTKELQFYPGVVIGGTFDRIHNGHKLLISVAALLAENKLTVGVADGPLLKGKVLEELIEPATTRIANVQNLIDDFKPGLNKKVVAISEPAGPSGTDDDLQLLVVSKETIKGGSYVNGIREDNKLPPLDVHVIDLLSGDNSDLASSLQSESKLSSSGERIRCLGLIRKEPNILRTSKPYVIGMTGGIATGKSAVSRRLQRLGASGINCDLLGHQAYLPGKPAYEKLVKEFGEGILDDDEAINRRALGSIVFNDKSKLKLLNEIVWPEIARMVEEKLAKMAEDDVKVCIVEAAVLLEAGWDQLVHEVWMTTAPTDESVKRIMDRNGFSEDQARIRIESQMSTKDRIDKSHVVISTLWEPEFTQKIVEKAWDRLMKRIELTKRSTSFL